MKRAPLAFALLLALAAFGPALAGEGGKEAKAPPPKDPVASAEIERLQTAPNPISDLLIELQLIQVRMANGDKTAYAQQNQKLRAIAEAIAAASPDNWKSKGEIDAAAAYVLSGGQPSTVSRLLESGSIPKGQDQLVRGALAYAAGRSLDAETLLNDIDPRSVSLRLGAQLAYARSVLATTRDPPKAIELLDMARLLAPGTLVEEAALRREILIAGDQHNGDRMIFLSHQYVARFPKSIFADNFIQGLAAASVRFALVEDVPTLRKFEALLGLVAPDTRRGFLLTIARDQTVSGKYEVAGEAARDALAEHPPVAADEARARLYLAAAQVLGDDYAAGLARLKAIDKTNLPAADQPLLAAVLFVATHLLDTPSDQDFIEADRESRVAAARSPARIDASPKDPAGVTIRDAELTLQRVDDLISRIGKIP